MITKLAHALVAIVGAALTAQNTWIVDVGNGPGTHFTQIAAALAAPQVVDGDLLLVRNGTYNPFATGKGVTLVGEGVTLVAESLGSTASATVRIENVAAGQALAMTNIRIEHSCTNSRTALVLANNAGAVYLDRVSTQGVGYPSWLLPFCISVSVSRCSSVTWNDSDCLGGGGISVVDSVMALSRVRSVGLNGQDLTIRTISSTPALYLTASDLEIAACHLTGGSGSGNVGAQPGLVARGSASRVRLAGDAASVVVAGTNLFALPVSCIGLDAPTILTLDPGVTLVPAHGAPPIGGNGTAVFRPLAYVTAIGDAVLGIARVNMTSAPGDPIFLALSLPIAPQPVPFGALFLDPNLLVPLRVGVQDPTGTTSLGFRFPETPACVGRRSPSKPPTTTSRGTKPCSRIRS